MEPIVLEATKTTPAVELDPKKRVMRIKGRSTPEDHVLFYNPLLNWFQKYADHPVAGLELEMHLEYFNTSTAKNLLEIFECIARAGNGNTVAWHYYSDDEDMREVGEDFTFVLGESMRLIPV